MTVDKWVRSNGEHEYNLFGGYNNKVFHFKDYYSIGFLCHSGGTIEGSTTLLDDTTMTTPSPNNLALQSETIG